MIPHLRSACGEVQAPAGFFERIIEAGFRGDVETSASSRGVLATDNSIYQMEPAGVLFPEDTGDLKIVAKVLSEPAFRSVVIAPRGGGTGTNGQSLTSGVVVDCSRHMRRILEIDPVTRVARVEAGVVKDQLNRALRPYGLFFAPELSTSNRATIGGMISTDACGQGSCLYGKTSGHVRGLRVVLMDGSDLWSRPLDSAALAETMARDDRTGEIYRTVEQITREKAARIREIFPDLNRYMTGYDLAHVRRDNGDFDLNAILCGSEGTLAMIGEAELNLLPIPAHVALVNIRYGDFNTALEHARELTALMVASVETVDEKVLGLAKGDIVWNGIARFFPDDIQCPANGINIVELLADDEDELERHLAQVIAALDTDASHRGYTIARGHDDAEAIWAMRKRAVGLLGSVDGPVRPVAFVEDTAVPPQNLAAYIREFRALLDDAGVSYGMFGHVDAGVLHVRPALDLTRDDHMPMVRHISDAVVALTRKYGGVLWGEHGKGVRSEYVPQFFQDLYPDLQRIKQAFDPDNRLNPGKIAAPASQALLKIDEVPLRGGVDRVIGNEIRSAFDNAAYCNGNGACFDFDETSPMCPSYKATGDRRQSPKGRAMLMREWLRLLAEKGTDPRKEAAALRVGIAALPAFIRRAANTLNPANKSDFSHEVREAMDSCLACKACAGQCPVKVSVPAFRARFLELYYSRYLRPLKDPLVAAIETTLPIMMRTRPLYNLVAGTGPGRWLLRMAGLMALPLLPAMPLADQARRLGVATATRERIENLTQAERERAVVFVPDAFTASFDPDVVLAAVRIARKMGLLPFLAEPQINGKALHVHGYLERFEHAAARTARYLQSIADLEVPLVGLDPSMTLAFRSEYRSLPGAGLKSTVLLPQEWLAAQTGRLSANLPREEGASFGLLLHCTERSNIPASAGQWKRIFEGLGISLDIIDVGCCGMAGTFGHEVRNRAISKKLYGMSWSTPVSNANGNNVVMATGYSCRSQVKVIDGKSLPHPLQVIDRLIG
ncbi:D-2-hydroxyglutarate dehydrogenase YdiJ [Agrobacterium salinitolerans]|uniref:D-2-hydroxyglutarate dehydrogenase n=2 Tax=Agrobacterium salinitolerans TaxID=1183413 RepID=A0A9X3R1T4_9HYPH|nr:FAD-binding and (Fe-S)-binding domain-containing protein [Agrobacterium salinitolerans]MCZ7854952.1 FAD-binding and (Fe-S)-binding domain-containing protein [Agrobacterium salinitolerans]MCZ7940627.1 FAD-binding and (Fe-S)-binding domain-containing protein [Agrobacterium salinitolerans]